MELKWTPSAIADLDAAGEFIARDNPRAANATAARLLHAIDYLLKHPNLGRAGRLAGTRELVVSGTPLVVIYRIVMDQIQVLRILHHARKWPPEES